MTNEHWTIIGVVIALIALIVAIMQLVQAGNKKSSISKANQKVGNNSTVNQQTHSGKGNNINSGRDINIK